MSIPDVQPLVIDLPAPSPPRERDTRGRFVRNNKISSAGGRARAASLTPKRRRAIARKGYRVMVRKHFAGDRRAQKRYLADLGAYIYDQMCGVNWTGSPLRAIAGDPGPIQEWRARYYTDSLLHGQHRDVEFYEA